MDFNVGDSVLLSTYHIDLKGNSKFKPHFIGPFIEVQLSGFSSLLAAIACSFKTCT